VNSSGADPRSLFVTENMGREGQAKARRRLAGKDADKELKLLLARDKEGMRAVVKAREVGMKMDADGEKDGKRNKGKGKTTKKKSASTSGAEEEKNANGDQKTSSYSANVIRHLGFDPAVKPGQRRADDSTIQKKASALRQLSCRLSLVTYS
jgi:minichromosome maintenance protein 10